jgi:hypothetical protein
VSAVFADTFYWIALTSPDDASHLDALGLDEILAGATIVTTDEVLTEPDRDDKLSL